MSTAGSSRPPMSSVSAIFFSVREPWDTMIAGAAPGGDVGPAVARAVGRVVGVGGVLAGAPVGAASLGAALPGGGLGVGGLFSSTMTPGMTARSQPTSMRFGSYTGDSGSRLG